MDFYIISVVVIISIVQSIFGVGVLLFGTPILLIMGYSFADVLTILLPISLSINLLQFSRDRKHINFNYYKKLLIYSIPPIVIFLAYAIEMNINVAFYIGCFLLFISLKSWSQKIEKYILHIFKFEKLFFIIQGVVHGLTNLGGSLLTSQVFTLDLNKTQKRATISLSYFTFALFQVLTLITLNKFQEFSAELIFIGLATYFITDRFIYTNMSNKKYDKIFAFFLFCSGLTLIYKSVI
jgi:uncharacterized membrane protein YfcA